MTIRRALLTLLGAVALTACAPVEAPASETRTVIITLTRTVCYGFCPAYTVSITGDGDVSYEGRAFVGTTGRQTAHIAPEDVARLAARFDAIGFEQLRDEYRTQVSDVPTYTVSIERNGRRKQVVDYAGLSAGMPQSVRALQDEIDRVANTARWVLRNGQPVRDLPPR